jgi:hypothetical protein
LQSIAEEERLQQELDKLKAGRADLRAQAENARAAADRVARAKAQSAETILANLRRGVAWSFSQVATVGDRLKADRIVASAYEAEIGERALELADQAIAQAESKLDDIRRRRDALLDSALREYAADTIGADYAKAIEALRTALTRCAALEQVIGSPRHERLVAIVPGMPIAGHTGRADVPVAAVGKNITAAVEVLRKARQVLGEDPTINLNAIAIFPDIDPTARDAIAYDKLSDAERAFVDRNRAR